MGMREGQGRAWDLEWLDKMAWPSIFSRPRRGETRVVDVRAEMEEGMVARWACRARDGLEEFMAGDVGLWLEVERMEVALVMVDVS